MKMLQSDGSDGSDELKRKGELKNSLNAEEEGSRTMKEE